MDHPSRTEIADLIADMVAARGGATVCPSEVARAIAGTDETEWRKLMKPIRAEAVRMARAGRITIRRKGRVADPDDFKGVYRLGEAADPAGADAVPEGEGAGNNASVRPVAQ